MDSVNVIILSFLFISAGVPCQGAVDNNAQVAVTDNANANPNFATALTSISSTVFSAIGGLVGNTASLTQDEVSQISKQLSTAMSSAQTLLSGIVDSVTGAVGKLVTTVQLLIPFLSNAINSLPVGGTFTSALTGVASTFGSLNNFVSNLQAILGKLPEGLVKPVQGLITAVGLLAGNTAKDAGGSVQSLTRVAGSVVTVTVGVVGPVSSELPQILNALLSLPNTLLSALSGTNANAGAQAAANVAG